MTHHGDREEQQCRLEPEEVGAGPLRSTWCTGNWNG